MPYIGNPISDFNVSTAMLNTDSVTSIKIDDGTIVNADINDSAAIAGTKISPDFGSQAISTTGTLACGDITSSDGNGNLTLKDNNHTGNNTEHKINFTAKKIEVKEAGLDETSKQIVSILDEYIKPAVSSDGGNILFDSYDPDKKMVKVILQGACSGCPSSTVTLKNGIESMLRHYIPEVHKVESI